jgi:cytochrome c oxidase subunit 1
VGGTLLFISGVLYLLNLLLTVTASRQPAPAVPEFAQAMAPAEEGPAVLDRLRPWVVTAVILIVIAYGPTLARLVAGASFNAPGFRVW